MDISSCSGYEDSESVTKTVIEKPKVVLMQSDDDDDDEDFLNIKADAEAEALLAAELDDDKLSPSKSLDDEHIIEEPVPEITKKAAEVPEEKPEKQVTPTISFVERSDERPRSLHSRMEAESIPEISTAVVRPSHISLKRDRFDSVTRIRQLRPIKAQDTAGPLKRMLDSAVEKVPGKRALLSSRFVDPAKTAKVEEEEEEYDPLNPAVGTVASIVRVKPRPKIPAGLQANKTLLLKAVADAHKSVANFSKRTEPDESVTELHTRKFRENIVLTVDSRDRTLVNAGPENAVSIENVEIIDHEGSTEDDIEPYTPEPLSKISARLSTEGAQKGTQFFVTLHGVDKESYQNDKVMEEKLDLEEYMEGSPSQDEDDEVFKRRKRVSPIHFSPPRAAIASTQASLPSAANLGYEELHRRNVAHAFAQLRARRQLRKRRIKELEDDLFMCDPSDPEWKKLIDNFRTSNQLFAFKETEKVINHRIRVCIRKKKVDKENLERYDLDAISVISKDSLVLHTPNTAENTKYLDNKRYIFDCVFDCDCDNKTLYEKTCRYLVRRVMKGRNSSWFAYGQRRSGKSMTLFGDICAEQMGPCTGLSVLAAKDLISYLKHEKYNMFTLSVSFSNIYGNDVVDLLSNDSYLNSTVNKNYRTYVIREKKIKTLDEFYNMLKNVQIERNDNSSDSSMESSTLLQFIVRHSNKKVIGKLCFVKLAANCESIMKPYDHDIRINNVEIKQSLKELNAAIACYMKNEKLSLGTSPLMTVLRDYFCKHRPAFCVVGMVSPSLNNIRESQETCLYINSLKYQYTPEKSKTGFVQLTNKNESRKVNLNVANPSKNSLPQCSVRLTRLTLSEKKDDVILEPMTQKQETAATVSSNLKYNNDESYECYKCHEGFSRKFSLERHIKYQHSIMKQSFKCPVCNVKFTLASNVKRHCRKFHGEWFEDRDSDPK